METANSLPRSQHSVIYPYTELDESNPHPPILHLLRFNIILSSHLQTYPAHVDPGGRSLAEIAGSNPAGGMDVCLLWMLCVARYRSLRRADPSSRGVLRSVVCLSVISKPQQWGPGPIRLLTHENNYNKFPAELPTKNSTHFSLLHARHMSCQSHSPSLHHSNNIWQSV